MICDSKRGKEGNGRRRKGIIEWWTCSRDILTFYFTYLRGVLVVRDRLHLDRYYLHYLPTRIPIYLLLITYYL